uniref:Mitochondrial GTPase 1 n=1 Tax=Oryctolagus cuniculus TaxID=9986 RepID=A0A5F9DKL8_RABIT
MRLSARALSGVTGAAWRAGVALRGQDVARWFPGHMAKGLKKMQSSLTRVDCVIEVRDARIPLSGRNPVFQEALGLKPHLLVLNKMDLADLTERQKIVQQLEEGEGLRNVIFTNCMTDENVRQVIPAVSQLIGSSHRYHRGEVSERPLVFLLDTPGVLAPRIESVETGLKLALCGTLLDHLVGEETMADYLLHTLNEHRLLGYVQHYGLGGTCQDTGHLLKSVAVRLGKTRKVKALTGTGDVNVVQPNYAAAARDFLQAFRSGQLGPVMLDRDLLRGHPPAETEP